MSLPTTAYPVIASKQQDHPVSGWRLLFALALMLGIGGGAGAVTWGMVQIINPAWTATVDFVVLVVAEVYAAVLAALLLAFVYGVGIGWVRERTGSTLNTAVMHVVIDTSLLIIACLLVLR